MGYYWSWPCPPSTARLREQGSKPLWEALREVAWPIRGVLWRTPAPMNIGLRNQPNMASRYEKVCYSSS